MKHPINITVIDATVGQAASADGVMGLFVKGVAIAGSLALDTPYLLDQLSDLTALGITPAYDAANGLAVYQQVSEFYAQAGDGALLWLVVTAVAANPYAAYVQSDTFANIIRYTSQADPANRVKMIGFGYQVPAATQSAADFPTEVTDLITPLQTVQKALFNQGYQFSAIIDGYNMSSTASPAAIQSMATKAAGSVSMCITGTQPNGVSAVGQALGRFARISVGHGFGAVEDGPLVNNTAYLTNGVTIPATGVLQVGKAYTVFGGAITYNGVVYGVGATFTTVNGQTAFTTTAGGYAVTGGTPVKSLRPADIDSLGDKQFLFMRTWFNHSGFYWNDGATCEQTTKALSSQEYNRVVNALSADALSFFIDEMGKNLPLNRATGAVDQIYLSAKQREFYNTYIKPLTVDAGTGDLSDAGLLLSAPNFNATKTMNFQLSVVPTPILGSVNGTVQFSSTL